MKTVVLHGALAQEFGDRFRFDVASPNEAIQALATAHGRPFLNHLRHGHYRVYVGERAITLPEVQMHTGAREIHFEPVPAGAGGGGRSKAILTIIVGIALVAGAFVLAPGLATVGTLTAGVNLGATAFTAFGASITYGNIALLGAGLILSGVANLLAPVPNVGDYGKRERPDEQPSFLFNGPVNRTEQGGPVPLVYGRFRSGSVTVSAGIEVEELVTAADEEALVRESGIGRIGLTPGRFNIRADWPDSPDAVSYDVQFRPFGSAEDDFPWEFWAMDIPDSETDIQNLEGGATYEVRVRAKVDEAYRPWSDAVFTSTEDSGNGGPP